MKGHPHSERRAMQDLWLPEIRRNEIKAKYFEFFGVDNLFDQNGLYERMGQLGFLRATPSEEALRLDDNLKALVEKTGINAEEMLRFELWMTDMVMESASFATEAKNRLDDARAEYIVCRIVGWARPLPRASDITEWYQRLRTLFQYLSSEAHISEVANRLGLSDSVLIDALYLFMHKQIEILREMAARGPLLKEGEFPKIF
ncbi:hypothetical protein KW798_00815 [Candidatus Parcubacteria bacterium]|nr:hypothetical protein [Candidatus Parcubacteria bacterium]